MSVETYIKLDLVQAMNQTGKLNTFLDVLDKSGISEILKCCGPFTIFAPNDETFSNLPLLVLERMLAPENKDKLVQMLKYHILVPTMPINEITEFDSVQTVEGQCVDVYKSGNKIIINDAEVIVSDIYCKNGIIHIINKILLN